MNNSILMNPVSNLLLYSIKMLISFISRQYLVFYIGIEILGINGVIVETIAMLSLLEMGLQSVIIYRLYAPIANGDIVSEYRIYSVLVKAYRGIGLLVFLGGLLASPFVYTVANTPLPYDTVYTIYFIQLIASVCNYFIICPRILVLAHQKQYINNVIDGVLSIIIFILQLISIIKFKNYYLYLGCSILQIISANYLIARYAKRIYLKNYKYDSVDKKTYKTIWGDLKHIIGGRLASFVYSSTDNLLISVFCGSVVVGYISNYKMITGSLRSLCESYHVALMPSFGNYFAKGKTKEEILTAMSTYNFVQFIISCMIFVPLYCLLPGFISLWLDDSFVLSNVILVLLILDGYLNNMEQPCVMVLGCLGYFKEDKVVSILAAIINVVFSIMLASFFYEKGILLGTVIAMLTFWLGRSFYVFKKLFHKIGEEFIRYWILNVSLFLLFVVFTTFVSYLIDYLKIKISIGSLIGEFIAIEMILLVIQWGIFHKTPEYIIVSDKYIVPSLKSILSKVKRRKKDV